MKFIPAGTIVTVERSDRNEDGETQLIPAVVLKQWPNSELMLYLFHFEGAPSLLYSVPLSLVRMVGQTEPIEKGRSLATIT